MPRKSSERYTVDKTTNPGSTKQVFRVQGYRPNGIRVRHSFDLRVDANEYRQRLYEEDEENENPRTLRRTTLSETQIGDAEAAFDLVDGRPLTPLISEFRALERRVQEVSRSGLAAAVQFFENHYRSELQEKTIYNAVEQFLESKGHLAAETIRYYKRCCKVLEKDDPNKLVNLFTKNDIYRLLNTYKNLRTQQVYKRGFSVFFGWAVNQAYCLENPCDKVTLAGRTSRTVYILSVEEAKRALKASIDLFGSAMAPSVALLLFAGLRPSELRDLEPEQIRDGEIIITGGKMGSLRRRRKPIQSPLDEWLKAYPFTGRPTGWSKMLTALNKAYSPAKCVPDIFRHTSLSFQLESVKDEAKIAVENGTSVKMLQQHYIDMVPSAKEGQLFWKLTPDEVKKCKKKFVTKSPKTTKKVEWPSRAKLATMVAKDPVIKVAKSIGVSDNAVRKHCMKLGIELPRRRGGKVAEVG